MKAERVIESGIEIIETRMPALLTVEKSINEPRFATLRGTKRANRFEIPVFSAKDINADENSIGLKGSPTHVKRIFSPEMRSKGELIAGEPQDATKILVDKMINLKII